MNIRHLAVVTAAAALLSAGCGSGQTAPPGSSLSSYIIAQNPSARTVHFLLEAGQGSDNGGFNFDGSDNGNLTYTVPTGWKVTINLKNAGTFPHSAVVTKAWDDVAPVFSGASSPNPLTGLAPGQTQIFAFTASRSGRYTLVCAVPGHAPEGMWIRFVVSGSAQKASVTH